jgi:peptide-methionine (R)-S-oxide reductase
MIETASHDRLVCRILGVVNPPSVDGARRRSAPTYEEQEKDMSTRDPRSVPPVGEKLDLTEEEWRQKLGPERYQILREQGTERAFTGEYAHHHGKGRYLCAGCGAPLFESETKFESGSGWPSFYRPLEAARVESQVDASHGMTRTEVHCARCGGHLGHIFPDGPEPTGLRYCVNSASLAFEAEYE